MKQKFYMILHALNGVDPCYSYECDARDQAEAKRSAYYEADRAGLILHRVEFVDGRGVIPAIAKKRINRRFIPTNEQLSAASHFEVEIAEETCGKDVPWAIVGWLSSRIVTLRARQR